jgi:hypothetical protein
MINNRTVMIHVDFHDQCFWADKHGQGLYDEARIENLVRNCASQGADILLWRLTVCGPVAYRSKVETVFNDSAGGRRHSRALARAIEKFDPLETGAKHARGHGLKFYALIDLYDKFFAPWQSRLLAEHPEYQWTDRTGTIHLRGVPCYAYPGARDWEIRLIREVLTYDVDGLLLTTASHSNQHCPYREPDMFGYDKPVVEEYKRRYGVDISRYDDIVYERNDTRFANKFKFTGNDFDLSLWHRLKGEYFTLLLREIREAMGKERKMLVLINNSTEGPNRMARHHMDWGNWAAENIIDGLILREPLRLDGRLDHRLLGSVRRALAAGTALYIWRGAPASMRGWENIGRLSRLTARADRQRLLDGFALHEAGTFEFGEN